MVCASSLGGEGDDQKKRGRRKEKRKSGRRTAVERAPLGQVMMFLFLAFFLHLNFPFQ